MRVDADPALTGTGNGTEPLPFLYAYVTNIDGYEYNPNFNYKLPEGSVDAVTFMTIHTGRIIGHENPNKIDDGGLVLYLFYEVKYFTLTIDPAGGVFADDGSTASRSELLAPGHSTKLPGATQVTRTGFELTGWTDGVNTYPLGTGGNGPLFVMPATT